MDLLTVLRRWRGIIALARPLNVLIAALSIAVAALISGGGSSESIILACLAGALITVAANAINDYFDIEIDRINKPHRPLVIGMISRQTALVVAGGAALTGLLCSCLLSRVNGMMAAGAVVCLYFYSARLKGTVLLGNLLVSLFTGLAFLFGSAAVGRFKAGLPPAIFAFLMHLGREIIKDMQDVPGDRQQLAATLPVRYGMLPAKVIATLVFIVLIITTWLPYHWHWYGKWYFALVVAGIYPILFYSVCSLWHRSDEKNLGRISGLLKADMVVGLLAIFLGKWQ